MFLFAAASSEKMHCASLTQLLLQCTYVLYVAHDMRVCVCVPEFICTHRPCRSCCRPHRCFSCFMCSMAFIVPSHLSHPSFKFIDYTHRPFCSFRLWASTSCTIRYLNDDAPSSFYGVVTGSTRPWFQWPTDHPLLPNSIFYKFSQLCVIRCVVGMRCWRRDGCIIMYPPVPVFWWGNQTNLMIVALEEDESFSEWVVVLHSLTGIQSEASHAHTHTIISYTNIRSVAIFESSVFFPQTFAHSYPHTDIDGGHTHARPSP